ncbi:cobalt-precorrin 5A hydrolase [Sphingomonas gellani]|uniref:Cobalt-precorrin 5A hydrolase n=1 Tax=Sphingomonas gellani TaxID=1166340 RepID=A0A1H8CSF7_9SPHN|nr:cobalamin biosynthesis protein [Sphingomonas gellani]SEM97975.1 cobalt-precorrin 5A hydrolase [Sphingomonas gellani]
MIVAGFGCRAGATTDSLTAALALASDGRTCHALAAPADRAPLVQPLADAMGLPLIAVDPIALAAIETPTRSLASLAARGVGSVAEAAAMVAAGPGARLLSSRRISPDRMATCAVAEGTIA